MDRRGFLKVFGIGAGVAAAGTAAVVIARKKKQTFKRRRKIVDILKLRDLPEGHPAERLTTDGRGAVRWEPASRPEFGKNAKKMMEEHWGYKD